MLRDELATHLNTRVTLPTHLVDNNGLCVIRGMPGLRSHIRMYVSDADIASTYPNGQIIMNLSKETTVLELCRIKGIGRMRHRVIGVNLTGGTTNAIEILTEVVKAPTPIDLLAIYDKEHTS